ncbi:MAG: hypothetical protein Q4E35_08210 [Eubacteriales bacterium]|nr:hypothetical protein [Eubacteriales bacterium]
MLDREIYGLMAALGIALALFFFFFYWINLVRSNIKLRKRCGDDDDMSDYIRSQRIRAILVFLLEIVLVGALYLVKEKLLY